METLSPDTLLLVALQLDLPELIRFCSTNKEINKKICLNQSFWYLKLKRDLGLTAKEINRIDKNPKRFYQNLIDDSFYIYTIAKNYGLDNVMGSAVKYMYKEENVGQLLDGYNYVAYTDTYNLSELDHFVNFNELLEVLGNTIYQMVLHDYNSGMVEDKSFSEIYGVKDLNELRTSINNQISQIKTQDTVVIKLPTMNDQNKLIYDIYTITKLHKLN
jgi:hypothetical protein